MSDAKLLRTVGLIIATTMLVLYLLSAYGCMVIRVPARAQETGVPAGTSVDYGSKIEAAKDSPPAPSPEDNCSGG